MEHDGAGEHERNQAETLLLLNEVSREANSTLSVEEVLRRSAELTKRLINYQIFSILLYDEGAHVFRHRVTVKFGQRVQEKHAVQAHEGIVGAAATLKQLTLDERFDLIRGVMPFQLPAAEKPKGVIFGAGYVKGVTRMGVPPLIETDASLGVANMADAFRSRWSTACASGPVSG